VDVNGIMMMVKQQKMKVLKNIATLIVGVFYRKGTNFIFMYIGMSDLGKGVLESLRLHNIFLVMLIF